MLVVVVSVLADSLWALRPTAAPETQKWDPSQPLGAGHPSLAHMLLQAAQIWDDGESTTGQGFEVPIR